MSNDRKKNRKRPVTKPGGSPFSRSLREASSLIQSGRHSDGLAALNRLAAESKNPGRRGKISLQIATSQAGLSRHSEAAAAFAKAAQFARQAGDSNLALKGGIGEVRSLLRGLQTDEAKAAAALILADLDNAQNDFDALAALTPAQLASAGGVIIPARPPRPTVGLTQLANAFIASGLTDEARTFLQRAVLLSPNGAARARQALAKLALAADQPAEAERYARESLQMGRFQAKTTASWQLYLDARARQNVVPIIEPELLEALFTHAKGRILCASGLSVIRVLRAHGDPAWKKIAARLLANPAKGDLVILTEIDKTLHADAKLALLEPRTALANKALTFFNAKDVSPAEQIAHSKEYIRYIFEAGQQPNIKNIVKIAETRFGFEHAVAVRQGACLAAIMASQYKVARIWLDELQSDLPRTSVGWGKATWKLARMESLLDNMAEAAFWYLELAGNESTPARIRIQAMLLGFKHLISSGEAADIGKVIASVRSMLAGVTDYRLALDAARQLALAGADFKGLMSEAAFRGTILADNEILRSSSPRESLSILEYLSRKLYWEINDLEGVLLRWDALTKATRTDFKAIGGSVWYEYLATIFKSMVQKGRTEDAVSLAANIINGETSTPEGYVIVGTEYAIWLLNNSKKSEAFECFEWIAKEAPSHRRAAISHYWLALKHIHSGDQLSAGRCAILIRKCFRGAPNLLDECEIDAKAILILGMENDTACYPSGYTAAFAIGQKKSLEEDIQSL